MLCYKDGSLATISAFRKMMHDIKALLENVQSVIIVLILSGKISFIEIVPNGEPSFFLYLNFIEGIFNIKLFYRQH